MGRHASREHKGREVIIIARRSPQATKLQRRVRAAAAPGPSLALRAMQGRCPHRPCGQSTRALALRALLARPPASGPPSRWASLSIFLFTGSPLPLAAPGGVMVSWTIFPCRRMRTLQRRRMRHGRLPRLGNVSPAHARRRGRLPTTAWRPQPGCFCYACSPIFPSTRPASFGTMTAGCGSTAWCTKQPRRWQPSGYIRSNRHCHILAAASVPAGAPLRTRGGASACPVRAVLSAPSSCWFFFRHNRPAADSPASSNGQSPLPSCRRCSTRAVCAAPCW